LLISIALRSALLLGIGLSGCTSPPTTTGEPGVSTDPGQDVRDQLAGHAAAAKDRRYVATYSLTKEGHPDRTVTVALAADGSWVVAEMNWVAFNTVDRRLIRPGGVPLIGFIY